LVSPSLRADARTFESYRWSRATFAVNEFTIISTIADTPFGLIAAGVNVDFSNLGASFAPSEDPLSGLYSVVVWESRDGLSWAQEPDSSQFGGGRPAAIVALGGRVLMFGIGGVCLPDACGGLPPNGGTIEWSTSDGDAWERLHGTGLEDGAVTDVAVADGGLIAVGYVANNGSKPDTDPFTAPTDAAVWRSTDGTHWDVVPHLPGADSLNAVRAYGSTVVAVGSKGYDSLVVWTSEDGGATWSDGAAASGYWRSAAVGGDGRIVVVSDTNGDRIDGIVDVKGSPVSPWKRRLPDNMRGFRPVRVVSVGTSFVIFGWSVHREGALAYDDEERAFSSTDGIDWSATDVPPGWIGRAPRLITEHNGDEVALVEPLDTLNGPVAAGGYTIWAGTASK
jgi:hypothetical protein